MLEPAEGRDFTKQFEQMTQRLVAVERRAQTLAELNRLLAQGQDPLALAQRAVDLVMRATGAAGSFVYLWEPEDDRLILRAASAGRHAARVGHIRLRLGEGVTGWAALMRQTVVLEDGAQADPRFVVVEELEEEPLRSMIAVPIVVAGSELLGVFTLWSADASAFTPHAVELASEVGGLLASGLAHAQALNDLRRQSAVSHFLLSLPSDVTHSLQRCVDILAGAILGHLSAVLCIIEVADLSSTQADVRPGIATSSETSGATILSARAVRSRGDLATLLQQMDPEIDKFTTSFGSLFPLGTITCFRNRRFTENDHSIVEALSAQAGALIAAQLAPSIDLPLAGQLSAAVDRQASEKILHDVGWRAGPTLPAIIRIRSAQYATHASFDRVIDAVREISQHVENIVWVPSAPTIAVLFRHQDKSWGGIEQALRNGLHDRWSGGGQGIAVGVGPVASNAAEVADGLEKAEIALAWAEMLDTVVPFVYYDEVAHLRKLPKIALGDFGTDVKVITGYFDDLIRHDLMHGTALANTLEAFLNNRGSMSDTSAQLFVHRNTLRQRLDRIEEVLGESVNTIGDWPAASLASRLNSTEPQTDKQ